MHIFLSGREEANKSAIIDRVLASIGPKKAAGFRCKSIPSKIEHATSEVYITRFGSEPISNEDYLIGVLWEDGIYTAFPEVYEHGGRWILNEIPADADVIVMDEIGVFEAAAPVFCAEILKRLDFDEVPIIGALPRKDTPFLDAIRQHPNVKMIDVAPVNVDEAYEQAVKVLKGQMG